VRKKRKERVAVEMQKQFELKQKLIEEKQKLALLEKQKEIEQLQKNRTYICLKELDWRIAILRVLWLM